MFPITEAEIVGLCTGAIVYGIYLVSSAFYAAALLTHHDEWKKPRDINWPMLLVGITLFSIGTLNLALSLYSTIRAFVLFSGGPTEDFSDISNWVNVMQALAVTVQTSIADVVLVYRCWVVYGKSIRVVALSTLLWMGNVVCTIAIVRVEIHLNHGGLVTAKELRPWITALWALTISLNIITTGLLVSRIWRIEKANDVLRQSIRTKITSRRSNLRQVIRNIMESGLLYTMTAFITFVVYLANSDAVYPVSGMGIQLMGIAFNLIIIRVTYREREEQTLRSVDLHSSFALQPLTSAGGLSTHQVRTVEIPVTKEESQYHSVGAISGTTLDQKLPPVETSG
ncbi:hypothetical protein M422DRAFT_188530 [Sphaerobolus stellatus SS14]|uniref:Uncharacterized protein n=1 Tax=Sphaerobolus stellatus (strain SS14) TaxID=990650 RepID=A0A0C9TIP4_SPHS4|nr:hypothetical protein M422DRAFT_188530 [Sphaerobolus stellatus SS14]